MTGNNGLKVVLKIETNCLQGAILTLCIFLYNPLQMSTPLTNLNSPKSLVMASSSSTTDKGNHHFVGANYPDSPHRLSGFVKEIFIARGWVRRLVYNGASEQYQITQKGARFLLKGHRQFSNESLL